MQWIEYPWFLEQKIYLFLQSNKENPWKFEAMKNEKDIENHQIA